MNLRQAFERAVALHRAGDLAEAERIYRACLAVAPSLNVAQDNLAQLLLTLGRYKEGFRLYEARFSRTRDCVPKPSSATCPEWCGEPVRSLLIFGEQGYGDQIQFIRFAKVLKDRGLRVTVVCSAELVRLFRSIGLDIVELSSAVVVPQHDAWTMLCSLPALMGIELETLPTAPYVLNGSGGGGVGLMWRGRPTHHNDEHRSLPRIVFEDLQRHTGGMSLDPSDTAASDFADTAEIIRSLDLVISVDTAVAHLAGAMGKPCWVMLPAMNTDWRWLKNRTDSPWYPSMRLYRQDKPGNWAPVLASIQHDLSIMAR